MQGLASSAKRHISTAVLVLFLATIALPSILAGVVHAEKITSRSIALSTAAPSATGVSYEIKFTADAASTAINIKGIVVDFCAGSPVIGESCTTPTGFAVSTNAPTVSGISGGGSWTATSSGSGKYRISNASATTPSGAITRTATGFTNPSTLGTFYARILTFTTETAATTTYTSTAPGTYTDAGGVAMSINTSVQVSAVVAETLNFCVSAANPAVDCGSATAPSLTLGHGSPSRLDSTAVDEGVIYYQVSTNASGTTEIKIKGTSTSLTSGSNTIPPVGGGTGGTPSLITAGTAAFGFRTTNGTGTTGSFTADSAYSSTTTANANAHTASVTSTYGDVLASGTGVMDDVESTLTFAATASATTPAGTYTAAYSLIATPSY